MATSKAHISWRIWAVWPEAIYLQSVKADKNVIMQKLSQNDKPGSSFHLTDKGVIFLYLALIGFLSQSYWLLHDTCSNRTLTL